MNNLKISIPSISENIRIVESFIDNIKESYNINDDIYGNIMIAVTESVNNAIIHGNENNKNKSVDLQLVQEGKDTISFTISDEGKGFDHNTLSDPTSPENVDKPGGRGIFLMKHLSDELLFSDFGRTVTMTFYLNN